MTDWADEKARELAADIDAVLHAGQRSEARYMKIVPLINKAIAAAIREEQP